MKHYALNLETIRETTEFYESLEYIQSKLNGIDLTQILGILVKQLSYNDTYSLCFLDKVKLLIDWVDTFDKKGDYNFFSGIMTPSSEMDKQKYLIEECSVTLEKLNELGYSDKQIKDFVENGYLIELSSCFLSKRQKDIIRAVINSTQEEVDYADVTTQEYELEIRFKEKELEEILALME